MVDDTRTLLQILLLYLPLPFYWAVFYQIGSRWTFQANRMNGDIGFFAFKPDQMQMFNPLFVLMSTPLFNLVIHPIFHRIGIRRPLQIIALGGILTAVSFSVSAIVQFRVESSTDKTVHMLWQIPQYVLISIAEIMFSVPGLTFSYEEAPKRMKSVVMSFWLIAIAFGNLIVMIVTESALFNSQAYEFLFFSGILFIDMLVFLALAYNFYSKKSFTLKDIETKTKDQKY